MLSENQENSGYTCNTRREKIGRRAGNFDGENRRSLKWEQRVRRNRGSKSGQRSLLNLFVASDCRIAEDMSYRAIVVDCANERDIEVPALEAALVTDKRNHNAAVAGQSPRRSELPSHTSLAQQRICLGYCR